MSLLMEKLVMLCRRHHSLTPDCYVFGTVSCSNVATQLKVRFRSVNHSMQSLLSKALLCCSLSGKLFSVRKMEPNQTQFD